MDIDGKKICRKIRVRWTPSAVRFLLHLWKDNFIELQNAKRKWNIYIRMARRMLQSGYNFNEKEIQIKLHNLTNQYKAERNKLRYNRVLDSDWSLYKPLDCLLGNNGTYDWKKLLDEDSDPFYETYGTSHNNDGDILQGNDIKMEFEEAVDSTQIPYNSSSERDDNNDEQSEGELTRNSDNFDPPSDTNKEMNDGVSNFRIIADGKLPKKDQTDVSKGPVHSPVISKPPTNQIASEKVNTQSLNLARWQLIQLQKNKTLREMEYQRIEFQQKTQEHRLRLKHMEEEHKLRMQSLRDEVKLIGYESN